MAHHLSEPPPLRNAFREFTDEMKCFAELGIYGVYFSGDRDYGPNTKFWTLLAEDNATQWSEAGVVYRDAIDESITPP